MTSKVRIETNAAGDLGRVASWLARHRGQSVDLGDRTRLVFGIPMSAARAVISAVKVHVDGEPRPMIGGVLRAISNRREGESARLVFEGRALFGAPVDQASRIAADMLEAVAERVAEDDMVADVA